MTRTFSHVVFDAKFWRFRTQSTVKRSQRGEQLNALPDNFLPFFFFLVFYCRFLFWFVTVISKVTWLYFLLSFAFFFHFERNDLLLFFLSFLLTLSTFKFLKKLFFPQNKLGFIYFLLFFVFFGMLLKWQSSISIFSHIWKYSKHKHKKS